MMRPLRPAAAIVLVAACGVAPGNDADAQTPPRWPVHAMDRPQPVIVDPGPFAASVPPPSDAITLFDGRSLDHWRSAADTAGPARWRIEDGALVVAPGTGDIATRRSFRDVQLHIEWLTPPPEGEGQDRGNSGVFFMGLYEVQVLDSWRNTTYPDGQAAALYGQHPPLVNASRPPGQWQSYDIVFRAPRFDPAGTVLEPARATVFHNGVLVHDAVPFTGATAHRREAVYAAHEDRLPIRLQDHGNPIRFRNIWVRELGPGT